jgi:hypothetical protein
MISWRLLVFWSLIGAIQICQQGFSIRYSESYWDLHEELLFSRRSLVSATNISTALSLDNSSILEPPIPHADDSWHIKDFSIFQEKIRSVILSTSSYPVMDPENSTVLNCHFPINSIMFTYSSHYTMDLILLQHQSMSSYSTKLGKCLSEKMIIICFDKGCFDFCSKHRIPNCIVIEPPKREDPLPPSDFGQGEYIYFTYVKHDFMKAALQVAEHIMFFDADVLIFKNPFIHTQYERDKIGKRSNLRPIDIMWQRDRGRGDGCEGSVNSGQIYLRNSSKVANYFDDLMKQKDKILAGMQLTLLYSILS